MIIEFGRDYIRKEYGGNIVEAQKAGDYMAWTPERIKGAFNAGKGTVKDLERYVKDNSRFAIFKEI